MGSADAIFNNGGPGGRRSGKSRDNQNKKAKAYKLSVASMSRLATTVTEKKCQIPKRMLAILRDIISARERCAEWYQGKEATVTNAEDDGHEFSIATLQEIHDTLANGNFQSVTPEGPSGGQNETISGEDDDRSSTDHLCNIFEYLGLEETVDDDSEWLPQVPGNVQPKRKVDTYELEPSESDVLFATWCFIMDASDIRCFIWSTWKDYKKGLVSLEIASLTQNAGIRMIKRMNMEYLEEYPRFSRHGTMVRFLFKALDNPTKGFDEETGPHQLPYLGIRPGVLTYTPIGLSPSNILCVHATNMILCFLVHKDTFETSLLEEEEREIKCLIQMWVIATYSTEHFFDHDSVMRAIREITKGNLYSWCKSSETQGES